MPAAGGGTATDAPGGNGTLGERTRAVTLPPCPICQTPGAPGEEFCVECGFLVGSQPGTESVERPLPFLADLRDGRQYPLRLGENVVGRERGDVVLPDGTVSRRHARLFVQADGEVYLEDLGSTNGTWRMGTLLPPGQRAALGDGTSIQFGTIKMRLSIPDAPLALPQPQQQPASGDAPSEDESRKPIAALAAPAVASPAAAAEPPAARRRAAAPTPITAPPAATPPSRSPSLSGSMGRYTP
jgi:hypothetical protein